jgi:hypothetical protein
MDSFDQKFRKYFFSLNFQYKNQSFDYFSKKDYSQLSFEAFYFFVAQELNILENVKQFFLAWTLVNSATSRGQNFDLPRYLTDQKSIRKKIFHSDSFFFFDTTKNKKSK